MNCKTCNNIVKAIQQLKRPMLDYPKQPTRAKYADASENIDEDKFEMAKLVGKKITKE